MQSNQPAASAWRDLSIVVPAYNEAAGIGVTLKGLLDAFPGAEIVVVDDCSRDETSRIARAHGARVVRHRFNQGQGAALKTRMRLATRLFVAWFDADNEHRSEDLARMADRIARDDLVAVIGQRAKSTTLVRGVGKWMIRLMGRGLKISVGSDLNCGLRVFRREVVLRYLSIVPDRFSASLVTTLIMVERRYPIAFERIETNARLGHSTVRLRDGFEAMLVLMRSVLLFAPMRLFLPLGGGVALAGVLYGLIVAAIVGQGLPVAGMLIIILGTMLVVLGLVADQVSQMRLSQLPELALAGAEASDALEPIASLDAADAAPPEPDLVSRAPARAAR